MLKISRKRFFDILLSSLIVIPAFLICIFFSIFIYFETNSTPIFVQVRVGQNNKMFNIYKIRTMYPGTPNLASHQISVKHLTKFGSLLRKYKIDELPQLLNILNGTMSFVGPRPCLPSQLELINERNVRGVQKLQPGITGPGQIAGIDMSTPVHLATVDSQYLVPWSLWRDFHYLAKTIGGAGRGDAIGE